MFWETEGQAEEILEGGLQRDLQSVAITPASKSGLSVFVLWHRQQVTEKHRLYITRVDSLDSLELSGNTEEEAIHIFSQ